MQNLKLHLSTYKAIVIMLVVGFSLSPCSLKRDLLGVFDIQHFTTLNKVKTTTSTFSSCQSFSTQSKTSVSKADFKFKDKISSSFLNSVNYTSEKKTFCLKNYSGNTSGNSPPKYILYKRLKVDLV